MTEVYPSMKIAYKLVALISSCAVSAIAFAQELHTFSNGEIADADKINENFQYVLQNGGGGCSAAQDGSSVVITCADGSSGVLASAGTVVVYPQGRTSPVDLNTFNSGDIILEDANGVVLGLVTEAKGDFFVVPVTDSVLPQIGILNNTERGEVLLVSATTFNPPITLYFTEEGCGGVGFNSNGNYVIVRGDSGDAYVADRTQQYSLLIKSKLVGVSYNDVINELNNPNSECSEYQGVESGLYAYTPWYPPDEMKNAAYPVRVKQLP